MSKSLEIMRNIRDTYAHMAECHEGEPQGTLAADWAAAADEAIKAMGAATTEDISAMDAIMTAFNTWPDDIKKKLSLHDLRRMSGWAPRSGVGDWRIDTSAGGPILVYQDCSVIEGEQARYLINLIKSDNALAALMESKSPWDRSPPETVGMTDNQQAAREWLNDDESRAQFISWAAARGAIVLDCEGTFKFEGDKRFISPKTSAMYSAWVASRVYMAAHEDAVRLDFVLEQLGTGEAATLFADKSKTPDDVRAAIDALRHTTQESGTHE